MALLKIENVTKQYAGHTALDNVSLSVPEKSIFGLLGPNGAGKTSLIRIINRITAADEGAVYFKGQPLTDQHVHEMGYLPEERGLYKKMKVGEHLVYLARLKNLPLVEVKKRVRYWLEKFDMLKWRNKNIEDLSKGMQQKIQFIATVLHEPKLIILDEPFSGFDPINANLIKDEILALREKGCTIIFSTHRMESVEELCDHIALINRSKKVLDGPKKAIKDKFKQGRYLVESETVLSSTAHFEIISSEKTEDGYFKSRLKNLSPPEESSTNHLIKNLLGLTELISVQEEVPSMNDVFIRTVGKPIEEVEND